MHTSGQKAGPCRLLQGTCLPKEAGLFGKRVDVPVIVSLE